MPLSQVRLISRPSISALGDEHGEASVMWHRRTINGGCSRRLVLKTAGARRNNDGVNSLQIEIQGLKGVVRYSGYPSRRCLAEIPILKSRHCEGQSVIPPWPATGQTVM